MDRAVRCRFNGEAAGRRANTAGGFCTCRLTTVARRQTRRVATPVDAEELSTGCSVLCSGRPGPGGCWRGAGRRVIGRRVALARPGRVGRLCTAFDPHRKLTRCEGGFDLLLCPTRARRCWLGSAPVDDGEAVGLICSGVARLRAWFEGGGVDKLTQLARASRPPRRPARYSLASGLVTGDALAR